MHNAPSVNYPVGRSLWAGSFLLAIWLAGASCLLLWMAQSAGPDWLRVAGWLVLAVVGLAALRQWQCSATGTLDWNGHCWCWAKQQGKVVVYLDLQWLLLLRWQGVSRGQWLCLEKGRVQPQSAREMQWHALRRAVYSRAIPDALQAADQPTAKT